ncbi:ROM1_3 [Blepharisma stoltei]|uniref:Rhomboid-like protease n=1 Tax=Blepharisma stoltei TaxID=1481888 RepID=A0AAU9K3V9_9CILI|nr:unnamed protein product [Blepharisma stoltei]
MDYRNNPNERLLGSSPYPLVNCAYTLGTPEEARSETFWQMLTKIACPFFAAKTFISFITIFQITLYIISVAYDPSEESLFRPSYEALNDLGERNATKLQKFQIWRWITPVLLHASLSHLIFNMIMQLILGTRLEPTVGMKKTLYLYFLCDFGGNLLGAILDPNARAVGASTSIFGMISAMIAWVLMNWHSLEGNAYRVITLLVLLILMIMSLITGIVSTQTDNSGHFGGMIVGFIAAYAIFDYIGQVSDKDRLWKTCAKAAILAYFAVGLIYFYGFMVI